MFEASDLRKGLKVEIDGQPYEIVDFNFVKPGKGQAIYNCKMKNMINGSTIAKNYRSADKIDSPQLEEHTLTFSYPEGDNFVFLNETFEQVIISGETLGRNRHFLVENIEVEALFHNGRPIEITLPFFVEKTIIDTEPGARGNTATNVQKPAKIEGGYEFEVPLFINKGDVIKIDTRTGEYSDRVRKGAE